MSGEKDKDPPVARPAPAVDKTPKTPKIPAPPVRVMERRVQKSDNKNGTAGAKRGVPKPPPPKR